MKKSAVILLSTLLLTSCASTSRPQTCPLTKIDTRSQEQQCRQLSQALGSESGAAAVQIKDQMNSLNCGLFFL